MRYLIEFRTMHRKAQGNGIAKLRDYKRCDTAWVT